MVRAPSSFLVRYWHAGRHDERVEIRQVQSRTTTLVSSMCAAMTWIRAAAGTGDEPLPVNDGQIPHEPHMEGVRTDQET